MKTWNFFMMVLGMALIFQMAGFNVGNSILGVFGLSVSGFDSSVFITVITGLLAIGIGSGIAVGYLTKSQSENYIILPFITTQLVFMITLIPAIINTVPEGWIKSVVIFILGLFGVGFLFSLIEFFRGTD